MSGCAEGRHDPFGANQARGNLIREAVSPSLRGYAAGNLRPVLLVQSRPTSPVMLVHLFETREEAETWMAAW